MRILFVGKRHYTHKDALRERFGRIRELPLHWHRAGHTVELALIDYRSLRRANATDDGLAVASLPAWTPTSPFLLLRQSRRLRPGVVVASGDCFIGLLALWIARRTGALFAFDVYDDYRCFGAYRAFLGFDAYGFLLRHADVVFYASNALATKDGTPPRSHVVPNGISRAVFLPTPMDAARDRTGVARGTRCIGYFGGMEPERGVGDLVDAVGLLHAQDPSVRLVLCGQRHSGSDIERPWVDYRGAVPHARVPDFINACDVVALPYRRGGMIDMASACKMAEYLSCQRPIVATRTPGLLSNFPAQAAGLGAAVCNPGDPRDLARAIGHQLANRTIVAAPSGHAWEQIAADSVAVLEQTRSGRD